MFNFQSTVLSVASSEARKKLIGFEADRPVVANLAKTIGALAMANRDRDSITDDAVFKDYKVPSGTGIHSLVTFGKVYLYEDVIELTDPIISKDANSVMAQWARIDASVLDPEGFERVIMRFGKLNDKEYSCMDVKKVNYSLHEIGYLVNGRGVVQVSDTGTSKTNEYVAAAFGLTFEPYANYGRMELSPRLDRFAAWLFGVGAVNPSTERGMDSDGSDTKD
jgi:hypothetical protein